MRMLAATAAIALLAACAPDTASTNAVGTATPPASASTRSPAAAAPAAPGDPSFTEALAEAYGAMAQFEQRAGSTEDAAFFQTKQRQVTATAFPAPEPAPTRTLDRARGDLLKALDYRATMPVEVATAQAAYDCWANDARAEADPVPVDCPRLFRDTMQEIAAMR